MHILKHLQSAIIILIILMTFSSFAQEHERIVLSEPDQVTGTLVKVTLPLSQIDALPDSLNKIVKKAKPGYHPKKDWPLHDYNNPDALPKGIDPALQSEYQSNKGTNKKPIISFPGIGNTGVDPADPSLDVGPNHVVQMINGGSGSYIKVFDKSGSTVINKIYFDNFSGISGGGDPIVIYDQIADRWLISEFESGWSAKKLIVGISQTADPTGSWYIYSFNTQNFPDYPKYAIWPEAYLITTNESNGKVYAIDRQTMLTGASTTQLISFIVPDYPTIGFQAPTPVSLSGSTLPPANTPAYIMRMADDSWSSSIPNDRLEIWELDVNFQQPSLSTFSGPSFLATDPFDTHLCGYTSFSCFTQPGTSTRLDPLREVLMNRIFYRNFGTHQSIVCNHVTDVNGSDHGGIRWYELRNNGLAWNIHQQSTYSPDGDHRWMASIGINGNGDIGLAYNVSSNSTYPSLRYTGRSVNDPLGTMTLAEATLVSGGGSNYSNRYGDYNTLVVDPANETDFWFTGMYNPTNSWSTHIGAFSLASPSVTVEFETAQSNLLESNSNVLNGCQNYKDYQIKVLLNAAPASPARLGFQLSLSSGGSPDPTDVKLLMDSIILDANKLEDYIILRVYDDHDIEGPLEYHIDLSMKTNDDIDLGSIIQHQVFIADNDASPVASSDQVETNLSSREIFVGTEAYFFNAADHKIMAGIKQTLSGSGDHFGCTEIEIIREGINPSIYDFQFLNENTGMLPKTYKINWAASVTNNDYILTLFYSKEEIEEWEKASLYPRDSLYIYALESDQINMVNPISYSQYDIVSQKASVVPYGDGIAVSAVFSDYFGSFGVGYDAASEFGDGQLFIVTPNPTNRYIYIQSESDEEAALSVRNVLGQEIFNESFESQFHYIDMESFSKGIYFIKLSKGEASESFKIILE